MRSQYNGNEVNPNRPFGKRRSTCLVQVEERRLA